MLLDVATLFFFPGLMAYAAISDLLTFTIPNPVPVALAALFIALAVACGFSLTEITWHFASGGLMLALGFGLFALGWIGGGDAKLAAATAIWLGFDELGHYALAASLSGGVLTLAIIGFRHLPLPRLVAERLWIMRLHDRGTGIPYGIALAAAGVLLYPQSAVWLATAALH